MRSRSRRAGSRRSKAAAHRPPPVCAKPPHFRSCTGVRWRRAALAREIIHDTRHNERRHAFVPRERPDLAPGGEAAMAHGMADIRRRAWPPDVSNLPHERWPALETVDIVFFGTCCPRGDGAAAGGAGSAQRLAGEGHAEASTLAAEFDRTVPTGQRERTRHDPPQSACAQRDDRRCPERGHRRPRAASAGSCAGADDICRRELDGRAEGYPAASQKQGHPVPTMSFTSNSRLARQIEQGAPANIFASADENWMDYLQKRNLIMNESRSNLLSNSLVLVVPASARPKGAAPVTIE